MPLIVVETDLATDVATAFDLARCIDLHVGSQTESRERAIGGCTTGLIELGESVVWEATHLGVRQELESRITAFDRPHSFRDSMVRGAFARFDHDHYFVATDEGTRMTDHFDFASPLGPLGRVADWLYLERYLRRLLVEKGAWLRDLIAEKTTEELHALLYGDGTV